MFQQQRTFTILRAQLEGKIGRECFRCGNFGYLAQNYRNKRKEEKEGQPQNKHKVLASRVMQCEEGGRSIRRQEVEEEVRCFRCKIVGHYKWECPNIEMERRRQKKNNSVPLVRKCTLAGQEEGRMLVWLTRAKVQEYGGEEGATPNEAILLEQGWITEEVAVTYMDCAGCEQKGLQWEENRGQGFVWGKKSRNMRCERCQEACD